MTNVSPERTVDVFDVPEMIADRYKVAWIDHAVVLGSPRVMINQGKLTQENKTAAVATLAPHDRVRQDQEDDGGCRG